MERSHFFSVFGAALDSAFDVHRLDRETGVSEEPERLPSSLYVRSENALGYEVIPATPFGTEVVANVGRNIEDFDEAAVRMLGGWAGRELAAQEARAMVAGLESHPQTLEVATDESLLQDILSALRMISNVLHDGDTVLMSPLSVGVLEGRPQFRSRWQFPETDVQRTRHFAGLLLASIAVYQFPGLRREDVYVFRKENIRVARSPRSMVWNSESDPTAVLVRSRIVSLPIHREAVVKIVRSRITSS